MALAFLIAFNSTSINVTSAAAIATPFAFGLPLRTVVRMAMVENLITGAFGTVSGRAHMASWCDDGPRVANMLPDAPDAHRLDLRRWRWPCCSAWSPLTPLLNIRKPPA